MEEKKVRRQRVKKEIEVIEKEKRDKGGVTMEQQITEEGQRGQQMTGEVKRETEGTTASLVKSGIIVNGN